MRALRKYAWLLIVPLLGIAGWLYFVQSTKPVQVKISADCTVTPDPVLVPLGSKVIWVPAGLYAAHFKTRTPFNPGGTAASVIPSGVAKQVTGDNQCSHPASANDPACYFQYDVEKRNGEPCGDPGFHIVPPN